MKNLQILHLEDSPLDAEIILSYLNEGGVDCNVRRVESREAFTRSLEEHRPDLILADYSLPSFDGVTALEIANETGSNVPFIFVSGAIGEELAIEILRSGATDYVLKQRLERLVPAVQRALREAEERAERQRAEAALAFLAEASNILASSLDYQDTLERVARLAIPALGDWCMVDVVDNDSGEIHRVAVAHVDPKKEELLREMKELYPPAARGPFQAPQVMKEGKPHFYPVVTEEMLRAGCKDERHYQMVCELGTGQGMIVPLVARGRALGVINLTMPLEGRRYHPADLELAEELAHRAAIAIDNARLYRELQRADRAKEQFLAMLAHELRNPLAPIVNALHILRKQNSDNPTVTRVQEMMHRQIRHMTRLLDDLLDVSRITRGKIILRKDPLDLTELVRNVAEDHRSELEAAGLSLSVRLPDEPYWMVGDATRLSQVIDNLLTNACKFTDAGGSVHVELTRTDEGQACIYVRDTGIGMEPEILSHIFDAFTQADRSLDRSRGGLGLGLALVRGLIRLHQGDVEVQSEGPGQGTKFILRLPLRAGAAALTTKEDGRAPQEEAQSHKRILVIEDNRDAADSLRDILELNGCMVEVAYTGPLGLEAARRFLPELILCDVGLPEMDGYAVASEIRRDPLTSQTKLIAVSGYGQEEDRRRSHEAGFDLHLTKPVDPESLNRLLKDYCGA